MDTAEDRARASTASSGACCAVEKGKSDLGAQIDRGGGACWDWLGLWDMGQRKHLGSALLLETTHLSLLSQQLPYKQDRTKVRRCSRIAARKKRSSPKHREPITERLARLLHQSGLLLHVLQVGD